MCHNGRFAIQYRASIVFINTVSRRFGLRCEDHAVFFGTAGAHADRGPNIRMEERRSYSMP
jgi:hypothetical protein